MNIRHISQPLIAYFLILLSFNSAHPQPAPFIKGADVSFLKQIEDHGGIFTEKGVPKAALNILRDHGFNYIRLRLWHTPVKDHNGMAETLETVQRIKELGFELLLNSHSKLFGLCGYF